MVFPIGEDLVQGILDSIDMDSNLAPRPAVAGYAYYDTQNVGASAIALLSSEIAVEGEGGLGIDVVGTFAD